MPSRRDADLVNRLRRHGQMRADQVLTLARQRLGIRRSVDPFDGNPRVALVTVNFATLRYLQLMLLTLGEQRDLSLVERIVVVHHRSREGGDDFLRELAARVPRMHLVVRRRGRSHAPGMRAGIRALRRLERSAPPDRRANTLLFCDPDVIFLDPHTIGAVAACIRGGAALVGEFRGPPTDPNIQASFLAVRRDVYARRDVMPWVSHGSPTLWLQRSVVAAGLETVHFPANHDGHLLHRGRGAVHAVRTTEPRHRYATAASHHAHYMGVPGGAETWAAVEARYAPLLADRAALLDHLADALA